MKLLEHHRVWLEVHAYRDEKWLRERFKDGFDVHHVDGNHDNNSPDNLVLIEHSDHMWLHFMGRKLYRVRSGQRPRKPKVYTEAVPTVEAPAVIAQKLKPAYVESGVWITCQNKWQVYIRDEHSADEALAISNRYAVQ